jgi:hypothetical protein
MREDGLPTVTCTQTTGSGSSHLRAAGRANEALKYSKKKVYQD